MGRGHRARKKAAEIACSGAEAPEAPEASDSAGSTAAAVGDPARTKTMSSFLRSRLYKAKSLGSLVKERILVEASHCQYEIWKRFGRKGAATDAADVNQNSASSAASSGASTGASSGASTGAASGAASGGLKRYVSPAARTKRQHCTSKECPKISATAPLVQPAN